jgi:malonate-semialdehyde dehydrogenase (acetylating)/methylmalonate-semialdehyde dehydrogenase
MMTATATRPDAGPAHEAALPTIDHWIDGAANPGTSDRFGLVYNPALGTPSARVGRRVDHAVDAATRAFAGWSRAGLGKRATVLFKFRELVERHADELTRCIVREHGKVLADARGEVQRGLEVVEFACGIPHLIKGEFSENVSTNVDSYSIRQPLGVVAGITPFNFPCMVPMWMYPVAIAAGNAFILKPSEKDPSASMMMAELWREAGLPAGVFSVVNGDQATVERILEHPGIAAVSFVGSTPIAHHVYQTATALGKRVQALGGAKNHMIVLPDADMELAADSAVNAAFGSAGERCMAISVTVAVGDAADRLVPLVTQRMRAIRVGDGLDPKNDMGPLVKKQHLERVRRYVDEGVAAGASLVADGRETAPDERGFFLGPCLFDHVRSEMSIYRDEIFGPVLSVVLAASYDEHVPLIRWLVAHELRPDLHRRRGTCAQNEVQVGMSGSMSDSGADGVLLVRRVEASLFGDARARHGR